MHNTYPAYPILRMETGMDDPIHILHKQPGKGKFALAGSIVY